ncbi:MAG: tetratricopeptide repeat protein, partial [Lachnospiraceae bacterium]|nr:tetratricopeptide repeat protein [Lachnospiraceae bacterium]
YQRQAGNGYGNTSYGNAQGNPYNQDTYNKNTYNQNAYGNPNQQGGYGSFWGFDFEDIFGFGKRHQPLQKPTINPEDSEAIKTAIDFIRMGRYDYANQILNKVVSSERNARWHYLSALANHGLGNQIRALEEIQKALQMEPQNPLYQQVNNSLSQTGTAYQTSGQEFQKYAQGMERYCMSLCAAQFFCMFCRCC